MTIDFNHFQISVPHLHKGFSTEPEMIDVIRSRQWDLIYIDDVVDGWVACVNDKINVNQTYNLGSGVKSFVGEMINEIIDVEGKTGTVEIEVVGGTPGDLKGCYADITKIKKQLNFEPKTSLKEGLKKFKLWADQKYSKL